jgi:nitrogen fixation protein FixH
MGLETAMSDAAAPRPVRPFTGRAFLFWLLLSFALVLGVNFGMAYLAIVSFNGVTVKSSYAAGKALPWELRQAAAQDARGWRVALHVEQAAGGGATVSAEFRDRDGAAIPALEVRARLAHPTDEFLDRAGPLQETSPGRYDGVVGPVRPGAWTVELVAIRGGEALFTSRNRLRLGGEP